MPECIYWGTLLVLWDTQSVYQRTNHRSNTVAANKQSVLHGGLFCETLLWYTVIVLMCWHPKVLVRWWLNSSSHTSQSLLSPCLFSKKNRRRTAAKLLLHHCTTFSAQSEMVLKKSSHLTFWFAFIITLFVNCTSMLSIVFFYIIVQNPSAEAVDQQHKGIWYGTWSYLQGSFVTHWGPGLGWR